MGRLKQMFCHHKKIITTETLEQYLLTLNKKTPHYRDTKKHYDRLKKQMFKEIRKGKI